MLTHLLATYATLPTFHFEATTHDTATHERFGHGIGSKFATKIQERYAAKASLKRLVALAKKHPRLYDDSLRLHERVFPQCVAPLYTPLLPFLAHTRPAAAVLCM